jgi:glutamate 5-kinase
MITKVIAAKRAARSGAHTLIASGREGCAHPPRRGEALGTLLVASATPLAARKQWLADHLQLAGRLILDAGAVNALAPAKACCRSASPPCKGNSNAARGRLPHSRRPRDRPRPESTTRARKRAASPANPSAEIEAILGYLDEPELIHRDNLVLL